MVVRSTLAVAAFGGALVFVAVQFVGTSASDIEKDKDENAVSIVAPDTVAPDTVAPDTVAPDTVAPDTVAPERVLRAPRPEEPSEHDSSSPRAPGYLTPEHTMGDRQSPLNILTSRAKEVNHRVKFLYEKSKEHVLNLEKTIEVDWDQGSYVEFDGAHYELVQFHFHTPSEHLLDGLTYPMEIHLVHAGIDDPKSLLVVGALFKEGQSNPLIEHVLPFIPEKHGERIDTSDEIELSALFEKDAGYYYYAGSLTTPPYSEVVKWLVLDGVHEASPEQVEKIAGLEGFNARHIQEPHSRMVEHCRF